MNCSCSAREPVGRIDVGEPNPQCPQPHDCTATIQQLVDVAIKDSLAFTTAALNCCSSQKVCAPVGDCGCGSARSGSSASSASSADTAAAPPPPKRTVHSQKFPTIRVEVQRHLGLATPLSNGYHSIPDDRITFVPDAGRDSQLRPLGTLGPTEVTFQIKVDATGLPGSVYFGDVRVGYPDGKSDQIVKVFIEL